MTPSIYSLQDDGSTVVGLAAKHQIVRNAGACVVNPMLLLNEESDLDAAIKKFAYSEIERKNDSFVYQLRRDGVEKAVKFETVLLEILSNVNCKFIRP